MLFRYCLILSIAATAFCWEYPGFPGVDCPTAREKMDKDEEVITWMIPKCKSDGTYQSLQCYDGVEGYEDTCMCVAPDGSPLTLPGFGLNVKSCICFEAQYKIFEHDHKDEMPKCEKNGHFSPLQCSKVSGKCWCVDEMGNVLVPPSTQVHSCDQSVLFSQYAMSKQ